MKHNYYRNINGWFDFKNFYNFIVENFDNATFVEIGTWKGKSLMYLAEKVKESGKNIKIIGIDTFEGSESTPTMGDNVEMQSISSDYLYETYLKNIEPLKDIITTIRGDSRVVYKQFADQSIDVLFIDGDHSYEAVKKDIELWFPKVKIGGIISGHDYTELYGYGVVKAVKELFFKNKIKTFKPFVWYLKKLKDTEMTKPMTIHPKGYWQDIDEPNKHLCDKGLALAIVQMFKPFVKTAVDIGCGDGSYTKILIKNGINCQGYDGNPITPQLSGNLCKVMDFADPQDIGQFDLVLSLEVGEHIPKRWEQIFINNLCRASRKFICMSWAIEGQAGFGHFNCQNNDYVINEMAKRYFVYCPKASMVLRESSDKKVFPWFANTILVFKKAGA